MMFRSLCALLALGCGVAVAAAPAKPLVFCTDAGPEGIDPSLWDGTSTSNVTRQIFQGLAGFGPGGTALEPQLATARQIAPDAKPFTFSLCRGVQLDTTPCFKREGPWITRAHSSVYIPIRRDVRGFVMSPNGGVESEDVWRE